MDYLRKVFGKIQIKLGIIGGASLLVAIILTIISVCLSNGMKSEQMAKRWSDDNSFSQVSCYFSELSGFNEDNIKELTYKLENKLTQDSISNMNQNARLWLNAYSATGEISIRSKNGKATLKAIGVGGDFFLFHPLKLINGSCFDTSSVMDDLIVIDHETAWTLFGSTDVVGQEVMINGVRHIISGVIERDKGKLNNKAGNNESTVYMSLSSLQKNGTSTYINMYEVLMPNPLTGYVKGALKDNLSISESRYELVENTGRFHFTKLLANVKNFGTRGMNSKAIVYPYWENMARGLEDYLTPVTVIATILYVIPSVLLFLLLIRMWKKRTIHKEDIKDMLERYIEKRREHKKKINEGEYYE